MAGIVDRYAPSEPFPRLVVAFLATSVPVTLFLWTAVYVVNMYDTTGAVQSWWGVVLLGLFLGALSSTHAAHVLVRDVADRARAADRPEASGAEAHPRRSRSGTADEDVVRPSDADPLETVRRRYAAGELTDDELDRRIEALRGTANEREASRRPGPDRLTE